MGVPGSTALLVAGLLLLLILLGIVTREWLVLRARQRQRGLFRRWPIPRITLDQFDSRFRPDALGPTLATEITFVGRGTLRVPGGTSDAEAWILAVVAKDAQVMFEFGTCTGKTAYLWARNQPAGGTVTTLTLPAEQADQVPGARGDDPVALTYAREESRISRFLYSGTAAEERILQVLGDSKAFDERPYAGRCDVVFVDGSHAYSYVVSDSAKALTMVRPGGLVLWHDYSPECAGVFRALNELAQRLPLVHIAGTTLVAHRRDRALDS